MTILAPLALLGLISLPVIYALYMREDAPDQMRVPTVRFWTEAASERGRRFKRTRPPLTWLMIAQMLIALVLVAALARPLVNVGFLGPVGGAKQLYLLINGGTSMSATDVAPSRFAVAKDRATALIRGLAPDETATVLVLGSEVRMLGAGDGTDQLALVTKLRDLPASRRARECAGCPERAAPAPIPTATQRDRGDYGRQPAWGGRPRPRR